MPSENPSTASGVGEKTIRAGDPLPCHGDDPDLWFAEAPADLELAKSLGLDATKVTDPQQLKSVLSSAFSRPGAKLIEVVVSNSVN